VHDGRSLHRSAALGAAASVMWGTAVGAVASSLVDAVGGTALALTNVVAGALVGWALRRAARALRAHPSVEHES
jgi:hypothetical protein